MNIEASPVSETTIQDASVLESCVQREFAPAPIWTKAMLAALQIGVKGGKWHSLINKASRLETLRLGWAQVERNAWAAGVDRMSVERFAQARDFYPAELAGALRDGSYSPQPVRRVYIPKGKGRRPLGIPAVKDRVVQAALKLVIEPIFEHEKVGNRIADGRVLKLVEPFLKQDIMDDMKRWTPTAGSPQGVVTSPLIANIYLHELDVAMREAGLVMVRYADDAVVLCRSQEEAMLARS